MEDNLVQKKGSLGGRYANMMIYNRIEEYTISRETPRGLQYLLRRNHWNNQSGSKL